MVRKRHNIDYVIKETEPENLPQVDPPLIKTKFVIHLLASAGLAASFWGFITDEHSVIHNIEPLHSIIHGGGLLKSNTSSFSYICLYLPVVSTFNLMSGPKGSGYFVIRIISSAFAVIPMILFYRSVEKKLGGLYSAVMLILMVFCPVLFISAAEMLTESFAMCAVFLFLTYWLQDDFLKGLLCLFASSVIAWPFPLLLSLPLLLSKLWSPDGDKMLSAISNALKISFFAILIPSLFVEYYFHGEILLPEIVHFIQTSRLDSFLMNAPFYFKTAAINFGLCFPLALISLPIFFLHRKLCPTSAFNSDLILVLTTPLLGLIAICLFFPLQETRFIFPLFAFFVFAAAMSVHLIQDIFNKLAHKLTNWPHFHKIVLNCNLLLLIIQFLLGMTRITGLYFASSAPINGFMAVNGMPHIPKLSELEDVRFCMQDVSYFPSSFMFPLNNWTLYMIDKNEEMINSTKGCHFLAGIDVRVISQAVTSSNWLVYYNSSMTILDRGDRLWWSYFPSYWKGYTNTFYILSSIELEKD